MCRLIKWILILDLILANAFQLACKEDYLTHGGSDKDTLIYTIDTNKHIARFYVIDFMASFCKPCYSSMPHFESLINSFSTSPDIQFYYANSYDNVSTIRKIIKKHRLSVPVLCDTNKTFFHKCNNKVLPRTLIINQKLEVIWEGRPTQLDEEILNNLIFDRISKPNKQNDSLIYNLTADKMSLEIELCRTDTISIYSWDYGLFFKEIELYNKPLESILEALFDEAGLMSYQLHFVDPPPEPYFNVSIVCPNKKLEDAIDSAIFVLSDYCNYTANWNIELVKIYKIRIKDKKKLSSYEAEINKGLTLYRLSIYLDDILSENIIYKGYSSAFYNFPESIFEINSFSELNTMLEKLGLELEPENVQVAVLNILHK